MCHTPTKFQMQNIYMIYLLKTIPKPSLSKPSLSHGKSEYAKHQEVVNQPRVVKLKREYACACVFKQQILNDPFWFKEGVDAENNPHIGEGIEKCSSIFHDFQNELWDLEYEADLFKTISVETLTNTLNVLYILSLRIGQISTYLKAPQQFMTHSSLMRMNHKFEFKSVFQAQLANIGDEIDKLIQKCSPSHDNDEWSRIVHKGLRLCESLCQNSSTYNAAVTDLMQKTFQQISRYEKIVDVSKIIEHQSNIMEYLDVPPDDVVLTPEDDLTGGLRRVRNAVAGEGADDDWSDEEHEPHIINAHNTVARLFL